MTSRSATHKRPLSAIFIGSSASSSQIPDLPDPPILSPSSSSGLPSPPATDSTGSGSNGGNSTSGGSLRGQAPKSSLSMRKDESALLSIKSVTEQRSSDDDDEGEIENDEDHTARFSDDKKQLYTNNDKTSDIQRVESLKQHHRSMLDRVASLTSRSRLSSPSPNKLSRSTRSPAPSASSASGSSAKLSHSGGSNSRTESPSRRSGSETEREHLSADFSSPDEPHSTFSSRSSRFTYRSGSVRERRVSAPSPPPPEDTSADRSIILGDSSTVGRRGIRPESRTGGDLEEAALAAVAKTRRESSAKRRQPLPLEFRDRASGSRSRASLDGATFETPPTPRRNLDRNGSPAVFNSRHSPSSTQAATVADSPRSPRVQGGRFSTVRDITRRNQTRWLSQDLQRGVDDEEGRPQSRRTTSGDSPMMVPGGRSVIGESLRAAGLARRRDERDDVFGGGESSLEIGRRRRLSGGLSAQPDPRPGTRLSDRPLATAGLVFDKTPERSTDLILHRSTQSAGYGRPSTSMASYRDQHGSDAPRLRGHRSSLQLPERERLALDEIRDQQLAQHSREVGRLITEDRASASPSSLGRRGIGSPANAQGSASSQEHNRLMNDSLRMFESYLFRLPSMGSTTTVTIPELFRSAQSIVDATETLNVHLRKGHSHALEEQINIEVEPDSPVDPMELWKTVGAEYRESLRVSDELVRTMTSFLLGVGKLLRESTSTSERSHTRTSSLDEMGQGSRRNTPDVNMNVGRKTTSDGRLSSDGRSSLDRRRWEMSSNEASSINRSFPSVQASQQSSASSRSQTSAARPRPEVDITSPSSDELRGLPAKLSQLTPTEPKSSMRRLTSFNEVRSLRSKESPFGMNAAANESMQTADSPLASLSRQGATVRRAATLAIPPSLPSLPSESLVTRRATTSAKTLIRRNKQSVASNATVRANIISLSSSNPTTAVTTTAVQASPERRPSIRNTNSSSTVHATISRTNGSALADLQQRVEQGIRHRTLSASSALEAELAAAEYDELEALEGARPRVSLDSATSRPFGSARRDRRGTVTSLFSRS